MKRVFVSYAREAREEVHQLAQDIAVFGSSVWIDEELSGGSAWWDRILEGIRACDVFVFALSRESTESVACQLEYAYALALKRRVLPVLIGAGVVFALVPESLAKTQFVDYRRFDKAALKDLWRALVNLPDSEDLPNPLPDPPPAPVSYLGALAQQIDSPTPLSFEAQTGLLVRLKQSLPNNAESEHVTALLQRFRAREDLYARVAEEVDLLLPAQGVPPQTPKPGSSSPGQPSLPRFLSTSPSSSVSLTSSLAPSSSSKTARIDPNAKKTALRMIPYGMYVLTAAHSDGRVAAASVNWVTQASFEPPLVVIGVKADLGVHALIKDTNAFALNVLGKGQQGIAFTFFKPAERKGDTISGEPIRIGVTGSPILTNAYAYVECVLDSTLEIGDHSVFVGKVVGAGVAKEPQGRADDATLWLKDLGDKVFYGG